MFDAYGLLPKFASISMLPFSPHLSRSLTIPLVLLAALFTFTPTLAQDAANEFGAGDDVVVEVDDVVAAPADAGGDGFFY